MNVWQSKADDYLIVQCVMLYDLEPGLQRYFERHGAYEMFQELKLIFQANARIERYEVSNKFYSCKMEENSSVNDTIIRKINSQLIQVVVVPRHSEYMFTDRTVLLHLAAIELIGDFIYLNLGICLKY